MLRLRFSAGSNVSSRSLDMTPMIDVVFLLLIFFILTSVFSRPEVLDLMLPEAAESRPENRTDVIHLTIKTAEHVLVEDQEIPMSRLSDALVRQLEKKGNPVVLLSADQSLPFQTLVSVLDRLQGLGLADLSIAVAPRSPRP